jgi:hypothetical protein
VLPVTPAPGSPWSRKRRRAVELRQADAADEVVEPRVVTQLVEDRVDGEERREQGALGEVPLEPAERRVPLQ